MHSLLLASSLLWASSVLAHMHLDTPRCLGCAENEFTSLVQGAVDYNMNNPLGNGEGFEKQGGYCLGKTHLIGTDAGQSVATWEAGQAANFALSGWYDKDLSHSVGSSHCGGSCQVGFALLNNGAYPTDARFFVAQSFEGNCPQRHACEGYDDLVDEDPANQQFKFTVPDCLPAGEQLFWWTWVNREQEQFHNCAVVTIKAAASPASSCDDLVTMRGYGKPGQNHGIGQQQCDTVNGMELQFPDADSPPAVLIETTADDLRRYPQAPPDNCVAPSASS